MKKAAPIILVLLSAFVLKGQRLEIQNAKISFEFVYKEVKGTIDGFTSNSIVDLDQPEDSIFEGSVNVASLDTDNRLRNWMLMGARYFEEKSFATISFQSKNVEVVDDVWTVYGDLTIKGITKPIAIEFKFMEKSLIGETRLYSSDFNIPIKKKREENLVNVTFEFALVD